MLTLKGFIIGIGKIIPGVSGSMLAISLGEYERMLYSVGNYFKDIINNSKYLIRICIGIILAIMLFSNIIAKLVNDYYIYTMFLFAGFIFGSSFEIKKETNINHFIIIISLIILLVINKYIFNETLMPKTNFIYYIFAGILDSITMIIPGISGTALLISYGCYNDVIYSISTLNLPILIPFIIGMILGIIITVKVLLYLFNNYKKTTYNIIIGISISTIIIMVVEGIKNNTGIISILISIILFVLGNFISKKMTAILAVK